MKIKKDSFEGKNHSFLVENPNIFKDDCEAFVYYFSTLNSCGLSFLLNDNNIYDDYSKTQWVVMFEKQFKSLRNENIQSLKVVDSVCNGCKKGCSGFTFLDDNFGFYMDLIIELKDSEIVNFMECFNLKNKIKVTNKIEQLFIKPFELDSNLDEVSF